MPESLIHTIKQAEEQADQIRAEAVTQAREMLLNAEEEFSKQKEQQAKQSKQEYQKLVAEARTRAEEKIAALREEYATQLDAIESAAQVRIQSAADFVVGRIVT